MIKVVNLKETFFETSCTKVNNSLIGLDELACAKLGVHPLPWHGILNYCLNTVLSMHSNVPVLHLSDCF